MAEGPLVVAGIPHQVVQAYPQPVRPDPVQECGDVVVVAAEQHAVDRHCQPQPAPDPAGLRPLAVAGHIQLDEQ
jgi:hypothetical protein